ncbi:MAG: T9SS type A sorting domain-containing protein [Nonlabens sp.]
MKICTLISSLLLCGVFGFGQTLPIDFENGVNTSSFVDFDGGVAAVTSNPLSDATNSSAQVARIVRDGGEIYAGSKIVLSNNLDFSSLTKISMDVYTTAPVGTTIKFKLENDTSSFEADAVTTQSGSWENLEWVFAGAGNDFNEIVFMFDFGNVGDGSTNSTFYFDNISQIAGPPNPVPASLPINFENDVVTTDFRGFGGASTSVIPNPQVSTANNSATVGQFVKNGGEFWAGSYLQLDQDLDLSTNWVIQMKVFTQAPIGTRLKLELENEDGKYNVDYVTTTTAAWETASWNFNGTASDYDIFILLFDFGNVGDGSAASTILFDDIELVSGPVIPAAGSFSLPLDFESGFETSDLRDFYGGESDIIQNPFVDNENPSATVGRFIRSGGAPWAQSRIILNNILDFSNQAGLSMKVYTDAPVGTQLKLKVHNEGDGFANEKDILTTVSGAWETYTWDFAGDPAVYNRITLMLGYDVLNDASTNATFYFDDITQVPGTLGVADTNALATLLYPTLAQDIITIETDGSVKNSVQIYDITGKMILSQNLMKPKQNIDTSNLLRGIYLARIITESGVNVKRFLIQ